MTGREGHDSDGIVKTFPITLIFGYIFLIQTVVVIFWHLVRKYLDSGLLISYSKVKKLATLLILLLLTRSHLVVKILGFFIFFCLASPPFSSLNSRPRPSTAIYSLARMSYLFCGQITNIDDKNC